ncbi:MAG: hypothetical protein Q8P92_01930 [Candidatus Daviesbacteria bacterium]|nr:hypothetical protein [Candidatus Daviesbacteria bacterium]
MYKTLDPEPISQFWNVWTKYSGLHNTAHVYHIGILSEFLGNNYQYYPTANILLKIVATLSIFPAVIVIFKNRLLAFLSSILFSISSATAGSLFRVSNGNDYVALTIMNIFFISYYWIFVKHSKGLLVLSALLFFIAYLTSPGRIFPLLLLIFLVEIFWLLKLRNINNIGFSLVRIIFYLIPVFLISIPAPVSTCCPLISQSHTLLKDIISGSLFNLLDPFASIGWTIFTNDYWRFFGIFDYKSLTNFGDYLSFLLKGPTFIFGTLTLILSLILVKKPLRFFLKVFIFNFTLEVLIFFIANKHPTLTEADTFQLLLLRYPTLVSIYILTLALIIFLSWRKNDLKSGVSNALWVGPFISIIFLWPMWVIMGRLINDWHSVIRYFLWPALGTSLFVGVILSAFYERLKGKDFLRYLSVIIISIIIFNLYLNNKEAIQKEFLPEGAQKIKVTDQRILQEKLVRKLDRSAQKGDLLIYFDFEQSDLGSQYYIEALPVEALGVMLHVNRGKGTSGCIAGFTDQKVFKSSIKEKNNEIGFEYPGVCVNEDIVKAGLKESTEPHFFTLDKFYAFSIENGDFVDVKTDVLRELGI